MRIRDITKAGALAGQLIDKGANSFEGIAFDFSQKEAKYDGLRGDAVRDALRKANSYVNGVGIKLGRVLEIATQPPGRLPWQCRRECLLPPRAEPPPPFPSSLAPRLYAPKYRSPGNSRSSK